MEASRVTVAEARVAVLFTLSLSLFLWSPRVRFTSAPAAISRGRRCDNGLFSPCLNTPKGPPF
ncbi:hypothetical protein E1A91_A07G030300v1 [Gossypium mustelinum]|uniref:Uncharacterized protein n=1 Tax=Gossypium mustelinum TaxID=34275 RepID=A0A5D2YFF7_GOSMU|nr:hypothetical protein E1A91_A07G030300v1 [Gossypium mustelinum]